MTRAQRLAEAFARAEHVRRQLPRLGHVGVEQVGHDASGLLGHAHDAVVAVEVVHQEAPSARGAAASIAGLKLDDRRGRAARTAVELGDALGARGAARGWRSGRSRSASMMRRTAW